jgi:hypothetical protein
MLPTGPGENTMATETIFSGIIDGDISRVRRVFHSGTQYFQSIDATSFGMGTVNAATAFAGTTGGVAGVVALSMSATAGAAVAGAGLLAACAGPQVAITAAVIGLALLVKGAYSNREAAHKALRAYTWNLVDDVPPVSGVIFDEKGLKAAADAATTLLDDGKNQIKLLGSKLQAAQTKFEALNIKIEAFVPRFEMAKTASPGTRDAAKRKVRDEALSMWKKESVAGGIIFEYVRRCSHTGNYIQAAHILALAMKESHTPGSVVGVAQPDYFANSAVLAKSRATFKAIEKVYFDMGLVRTTP